MLGREKCHLLDSDYTEDISKFIGFMSFRFLKLSLQFPIKEIENCLSTGLGIRALESNFITNLEIKNESLIDGLMMLSLQRFPSYFDAAKVKLFMSRNSRINESKTSESEVDGLSNKIFERVLSKEWLLMSRY